MRLLILSLMESNLKVDWLKKLLKKLVILSRFGERMKLIKIDLLILTNQR